MDGKERATVWNVLHQVLNNKTTGPVEEQVCVSAGELEKL